MVTEWKVGPYGYGSTKGSSKDIDCVSDPPGRLVKITIWYSMERINAISFTYETDAGGKQIDVPAWGSQEGDQHPINIDQPSHEYVEELSGTYDDESVTSLKITTNINNCYGPYGEETGTHFRAPSGEIVAFFGRASSCLNAIGAYIKP